MRRECENRVYRREVLCLAVTVSTSTCLETIINKIRPITLNSHIFLRASCGSFLSNASGKEADVFQIAVDSNLDKAANANTPVPQVPLPLFLIIFPTITVVALVAFPSKQKKPWNLFPDRPCLSLTVVLWASDAGDEPSLRNLLQQHSRVTIGTLIMLTLH